MEENNTPKNKKTVGMLIMILALVLVAVILVIVIVASSGGNDETTPGSSAESTPIETSTKSPDETTTTPDSSTEDPVVSTTPTTPAVPTITETPTQADATGKVTVNSEDAATGLLININADKPYSYQVDNRFLGTNETPKADVEAAGFYRFAANDLKTFNSKGYGHFLRQEAYKALVSLIEAFDAVAGTDRPFVLAGYTAETALTNTLVSGNVVQLTIRDASGDTYNFDHVAHKVTVNGETMTYVKWFEANCTKFGFVYEGMVGNAGEFRYVGSIHAAGVAAAGSLSAYTAGVKNGTIKTATAADGSTWNLSYVAASDEATTEITVGANATYVISGDNDGGFIVAVKA